MARRPGSLGKHRHDPQPTRLRPPHRPSERPRGPTRPGQTARPTPIDNPNNPPPPRAGWPGSLPEWVTFWWLSQIRKLVPHLDFDYTPPLSIPGGVRDRARPDFVIWRRYPPLALEVQGLHYHLGRPDLIQAGIQRKLRFASAGYRMLFLWEDDLLSIPNYVLSLAVDHLQEFTYRPGAF